MAEKAIDSSSYIEDHRSGDADELGRSKTYDTVHLDEAVKVVGAHDGGQNWSTEEERKVVRKIDSRLMPLLVITYGIQFYDKAMLSHAVTNSRTIV